jgi:hypothetical protein
MEIEEGTGVEGIDGRFSRKFLDSEQLGIGLEVIAVGDTRPEDGDSEFVADCWPQADG